MNEIWDQKMASGVFRYDLSDVRWRILEGRGWIAEFIPNRAVAKRGGNIDRKKSW